jgi:hypothetical protein
MRRAALTLGIAASAAAIFAALYFGWRRQELLVCRTCGAERYLTRRTITGGVLEDRTRESTVAEFARSRFGLAHDHRWSPEQEIAQGLERLKSGESGPAVRPWTEASALSVMSIARKFESHRAGLGQVFLRVWLDPEPEMETGFLNLYFNLLAVHEAKLMGDPTCEQMTVELYAPILISRQVDPQDQTKLKIWVQDRLK